MRARGHQIEIYSLFAPEEGKIAGVTYGWARPVDHLSRKAFPVQEQSRLARRWASRFAAGGYDAIVAHFASQPSTVALLAAGNVPFVLSAHARDLYVEAERLDEKVARARAVVTCTQENVRFLTERYPQAAQKIHGIYHGLPSHWLETTPPERPHNPDEPLRLLAAGRFVEKKGFTTFLDACARLHKVGVPVRAVILGDGPLRQAMFAHRRELDIYHELNIEEWADEETMRNAYIWADVFCCPSIVAEDGDRDGLPNVILEAMSTGLPCIGSRVSGIPEAVVDGETGLLVPPGDAAALAMAISCCADPELRAAMGAHAAARVREQFSADYWLARLEAVIAGA
jgi:glycosyltransferase involved in cell wall biosynthesis